MSNLKNKLKEDGFCSVIKWAYACVMEKINSVALDAFRLLKVKDDRIVFESEGDFSDNSQALYQYMSEKGYLKKYQVIWLVYDKKNYSKKDFLHTKFCSKKWGGVA